MKHAKFNRFSLPRLLGRELEASDFRGDGFERLIAETHAQVQIIRKHRGLPPHDFSKHVPSKSEKWAQSEKVQQSYKRKSKRKAASA